MAWATVGCPCCIVVKEHGQAKLAHGTRYNNTYNTTKPVAPVSCGTVFQPVKYTGYKPVPHLLDRFYFLIHNPPQQLQEESRAGMVEVYEDHDCDDRVVHGQEPADEGP